MDTPIWVVGLLISSSQYWNDVLLNDYRVAIGIGILIFFSMMIKKWTTERVLTNSRFIKKTGWIRRNTEEIPIDRMEEVNLNQTIHGRIFGYGNVTISGMGIGKINLNMIDDPLGFQRKLNDLKVNLSAQAP